MTTTEARAIRRGPPTTQAPEVRVVVTGRVRTPGRLDTALDDPPDDPSIEAVVAAATAHAGAGSWMIAGGEPTLREDIPRLVKALADAGATDLGMITDGLVFASPKVPKMFADLGLTRVRIRLHSGREDAHDWLVDQPGAWRRAVKAVRACADAGLATEVEVTLTRPTRPYTAEALDLFARLGARTIWLRRLTARGPAAQHDIPLVARFGLMQRDVEQAVQSATRAGATVVVEGFPACALPALVDQRLPQGAVQWAVPKEGGWSFLEPRFDDPPAERGCATCPGPPECAGAPSDYVRRHGRMEIDSEGVRRVNPGTLPPTPLEGGDVYPPPRAGRFPPSRLSYVRLGAKLPSLGGDPLVAERATVVPERLRFAFVAPPRIAHPVLGDAPAPPEPEDTRDIRVRLVQAAQHGARCLHVQSAGTLAHPDAAEMLREATRLQFPRIEVAGEASAMDGFSDMQLRRLRGISRVDIALFGPDAATHDAVVGVEGAFDAALKALDRVGNLVPSIELGAYAVLMDPAHVAAFAEAWDFGDLPGDPFFRLAPTGGDLVALAAAADALPEGPARDALAAVLPKKLFPRGDHVVPAPEALEVWGDVASAYRKPSGSDRYGCYTGRPTPASAPSPGDDPGVAVGWTAGD